VQEPAQIEAVFARIGEQWGSLDVLVHCLAFAGKEELIGDYSAISPEGFARALEVSAYSLAPLCRFAKPLFNDGASVITLSYLGAERAIPNYNVMGVAKAALEASVRYLAAELGPGKQVRVNAISAGPIRTLAGGITGQVIDVDAGYCITGMGADVGSGFAVFDGRLPLALSPSWVGGWAPPADG
jgi:enoyl-[acyl-carrier protein] reductase I